MPKRLLKSVKYFWKNFIQDSRYLKIYANFKLGMLFLFILMSGNLIDLKITKFEKVFYNTIKNNY